MEATPLPSAQDAVTHDAHPAGPSSLSSDDQAGHALEHATANEVGPLQAEMERRMSESASDSKTAIQ